MGFTCDTSFKNRSDKVKFEWTLCFLDVKWPLDDDRLLYSSYREPRVALGYDIDLLLNFDGLLGYEVDLLLNFDLVLAF